MRTWRVEIRPTTRVLVFLKLNSMMNRGQQGVFMKCFSTSSRNLRPCKACPCFRTSTVYHYEEQKHVNDFRHNHATDIHGLTNRTKLV